MSDDKIARLACMPKGETLVASEYAKCVECGIDVGYDPVVAANVRKQHPEHRLEFVCLGCSGDPRKMGAQELGYVRNALKGGLAGLLAQSMTDDELREILATGWAMRRRQ